MSPQPEEDLQRRLQNLESEINSKSLNVGKQPEKTQTSPSDFLNVKSHFVKLRLWFNNLSGTTKLIVAGVGALLGLAMLQTVLKLVTSVVSLALIGFLVYLGYKFFVSGNFQNKQ
ncbi:MULTISPECIES: hypothetical protein [unclassified Anabaena]|uniref:hypothetical protein n=1 Tax=unclassified Anabaena TaxID=2619674 RepID=UPI0039C6B744